MDAFKEIILQIETTLLAYYNIPPEYRASDFLLCTPPHRDSPRACVFLSQDDEYLDLGIYFHSDIIESCHHHNPLQELTQYNLDVLCCLAEEISHFHMILLHRHTKITRLDLELQGEIDKLLIASLLLFNQSGRFHLHPLIHIIFHNPHFSNEDPVYVESNKMAAQFWKQAIANGLGDRFHLFDPTFRRLMANNLRTRLQHRKNIIEKNYLSA